MADLELVPVRTRILTHNDDIARLADRIIRIEDGKITGGMEL